jgi:hypothetical protein
VDNTSHVTRKIGSHTLPNGKEIILYGFGLIEWTSIQEAALSHFKRSIIKTVTDTMDLLPEEIKKEELRRAYDEAKRLTIDQAPSHTVRVPETDANGNLKMNGDGQPVLREEEMDYTSWWMSETVDGKLCCLWLSARKAPGQEAWTKEHISELFSEQIDDEVAALEIEQAAQTVGRLSQSELAGNSSSPPDETRAPQTTTPTSVKA